MSNFEQATRRKFRFPSVKGELTTEQLWDAPLVSRNGFDLDAIAKAVNAELAQASEESFVETKPNPRRNELAAKLEIVKHVIGVKIKEKELAENRSAKAAQRQTLQEALDRRQNAELENLSPEELRARIAALDAPAEAAE